MKKNNRGITVINLVITIAILGILIIGFYFGIKTMLINTKKDNFVNTAKEYVNGAKEQLLSENMMPSSGEAQILSFSQIELGKEYLSPYKNKQFLEDYSYVVVLKDLDGKYQYYVTQTDELGNCMKLVNYDRINEYGSKKREFVINNNTCNTQSILLVGPDYKLKDLNLDFDVKFYKYEKN